MSLFTIIKIVLFKVFIFLLSVIITPILVFVVLPFLSPTYLYRYILTKVFKYFRPDLSKILTTRSTLLATDDLYKKPRCTLVVHLILGRDCGPIDKEIEYLMKHLILLKNEQGELKRPEFQQYITSWMGFYWWKWDPNFKPEYHMAEYNGPLKNESYDEPTLYDIGNELATKPFKKKQSPWEFVLLRNCTTEEYPEPFTALMIRIHHSLADGYSILKLTTEIISSKGSLLSIKPEKPQLTTSQLIYKSISFIFKAPYEFFESVFTSYDRNEWHISEKKLTRVLHGAFHTRVTVDYIREIKNLHGTSFTSVILAGFAGGIRKYMLENSVRVPKSIHCFTPIPMYNHPEYKLRNVATFCFTKLPVGSEDPLERLRLIQNDLKKLRTSTVPLTYYFFTPLIGAIFPVLIRPFVKILLVTAIISNFPGPKEQVYYNNGQIPILDMMFGGGLINGNVGLGLSAFSYNGFLRIGSGLDEALLKVNTPLVTRSLISSVAAEFDLLRALGTV